MFQSTLEGEHKFSLFKGKGACCLDVNCYRGISLLTNYNTVYEILLWGRMSKWWDENKVISDLQGAGKKGQSCVHTALVLQEAIAAAMEKGERSLWPSLMSAKHTTLSGPTASSSSSMRWGLGVKCGA